MNDYAAVFDALFAAGQIAGVLLVAGGGWLSVTAWPMRTAATGAGTHGRAAVAAAAAARDEAPAIAARSTALLHDEPSPSLSTPA